MPTNPIPTFTLNTGAAMPVIGLGTWPLDDNQVAPTVADAVQLGYRLIDTAAKYRNEAGVGEGIRRSGVARDELFVTTKLDGPYQGQDRAIGGLDGSLNRLGLDYVDLLMIHWPLPDRDLYVDTWATFGKLLAGGRARAIGVSNFKPAHLQRLIAETGTVPAVDQIELNPALARSETRAYNSSHGIVTQAWSPLGRGGAMADPVITAVADRVGRTPAQVVLRWHFQLDVAVVPKSANPTRLAENLKIFDFELTEAEMTAMASLDQGETFARDSDVEGH